VEAGSERAQTSGEHERRLAVGTLGQQAAQAFAVVAMLGVVTAVARSRSLSEFGTYGLVVSFSAYLLFVQGSVEATAIREIAAARTKDERDRAFTTAVAVYAGFGFLAGLLIATAGVLLLELFKIPSNLEDQARLGVLAIAATTFVGWPMKTFQDGLRGTQRFIPAAGAEALGYCGVAAATAVLLFAVDAPLWTLIAVGGSIPLFIGVAAAGLVLLSGVRLHLRPRDIRRGEARHFLGTSGYILLTGLTDVVIYSLDRAVLATFRSAATVGLYEAAVRPQNLVRQLHATFSQTVLPASSRYLHEGDTMRVRELLLRGTRYTLAATVPVTVTLMVLAGPILEVWLGERFGDAATAMVILLSFWLWAATNGVSVGMLVAAGQVRALVGYSWGVAGTNLCLSLALTPLIGLEGVVLGTAVAYAMWFPYFVRLLLRTFPVSLREYLERGFVPAYVTGAALAAVLALARLTLDLDNAATVAVVAIGGVLAYWAAFYRAWLSGEERTLVRDLLRFRRSAAADLP
jgi:O-antigen/teichoic acid export membrane protein